METNQNQPVNPYHERLRAFANGNISKENEVGEYRMLHLRLPLYVYKELNKYAFDQDIKISRLIIELLRGRAHKLMEARAERDKQIAEIIGEI